jgi:hypothetical protein
MSITTNELHLLGTRAITINKSGKQEVQTISCFLVSFNETINQQIINSDDSYEEYCKQVRAKYCHRIPTFIWDLEENKNKPEMIEREEAYFKPDSIYNYENPNPLDIVGYERSLSEKFIEDTDADIKYLIDNDYDIEWSVNESSLEWVSK